MDLFKLFKRKMEPGFSIVEMLVAMLIILILGGVAIPTYTSSKIRAYQQAVITDGDMLFREISATIGDINVTPSFGTTNGSITLNTSTKVMTITLGSGVTSPAAFTENVSNGTSVSGVTYANSTNWCLEVFNHNRTAVFTQTGLSSTLVSCGAGSSGSNHFYNSSFETDTSSWSTCYNPGGLTNSIATSTAQAQIGSQSLLRTVTSGTGVSQMNLCASLSSTYLPNKSYTFSTYVYTNRAHTINFLLSLNASSGTTYPGTSVAVPANTWTFITYTATMPSDLVSLSTIQLVDSPITADLLYVDNAQSY